MLKKIISISLICIYCLIILKNFIPQLVYTTNLDYIIKNLCEQKDESENLCMGHCYLNKKVKEEAEENTNSVPAGINLKNLELHFMKDNTADCFKNILTDSQIFCSKQFFILTNSAKPLLPPPKIFFS